MPRPRCCRRVSGQPACMLFKPAGLPASSIDEVSLGLDEFEAIRLADFEGLYQEEAAGRMGVSRQTFGRTIETARRKVARALVQGLALRIDQNADAPEAEAAGQTRPGPRPAHRQRPHTPTPHGGFMLKIAIPTRAGAVDGHFGHCESFTIYSLDEAKAVTGQESYTPPPACGCKSSLIPALAEMGVSLLIGGNMGQGAVDRLAQAGITVIRGASGPVDAVLKSWLDGSLKDSQLLCMEHGQGHICHHGS